MFKDSFNHRKKYYTTLFVSIYVLIFAICALVIAANWKYVKLLFEPQNDEISVEQQQFNELFAKVKYLEDLSKEYDKEDYQLRAVMYIRYAQYLDSEWEYILGDFDEDFVSYVEINEGDKNVSSLRNLGFNYTFKNPTTKQDVDFYKLFVNLNAIMLNDNQVIDAVSWGGYICQNAINFKNRDVSILKNEIKMNMQTKSKYGDYSRYADYDSINIYNLFKSNTFVYDSIYLSIVNYYANFDKTTQINNFIDFVGFDKESENIVEDVYFKLQNNDYLQVMCDNGFDVSGGGFDYPDIGENEDETQNAIVFKTAIEAYVEFLGLHIVVVE